MAHKIIDLDTLKEFKTKSDATYIKKDADNVGSIQITDESSMLSTYLNGNNIEFGEEGASKVTIEPPSKSGTMGLSEDIEALAAETPTDIVLDQSNTTILLYHDGKLISGQEDCNLEKILAISINGDANIEESDNKNYGNYMIDINNDSAYAVLNDLTDGFTLSNSNLTITLRFTGNDKQLIRTWPLYLRREDAQNDINDINANEAFFGPYTITYRFDKDHQKLYFTVSPNDQGIDGLIDGYPAYTVYPIQYNFN